MKKFRQLTLIVAVMAVMFAATVASADTVTLNLMNANPGSLGTPPFGTVTGSLTGTDMTVTISMLGGFTIRSLNGINLGFNATGSGLTVSDIFGSANADGSNSFSVSANITSGDVDIFGYYGVVLSHMNPASSKVDGNYSSISFVIHGVSSLDNLGFVVHVVNQDGFEGFVTAASDPIYRTNDAGAQVPEPASLFLLGTGLLTGGGYVRRKLKK